MSGAPAPPIPWNRRRSRRALWLIAGLISALAATQAVAGKAELIRLRCVGERIIVADSNRQRSPWEQRFTIDLNRQRWCEADCSKQHPIVAAKPDVIDLINEMEDGFATSSHVSRETGAFRFLSIGRVHGQTVETAVMAQCERLDGG